MDESDADAPSPVPLRSHIDKSVKGHTEIPVVISITGVMRHGFFA